VKNKSNKSLVRNVLASVFGVCLVLGILNFKLESDRNEKNSKKSASQSAQVVVGEDTDQAVQEESEASKKGANTSQEGNGENGSIFLAEKGNSGDTKTKISRKVAPYASGAGAWPVSTATKEQKKTYKIVSQIDPRRSISEILENADMSDPETRAAVVAFMSNREEVRYEAVLAKAELLGIPVRLDGPGHKVSILYDIRGEEPLYRTTLNANAAISTGANLIRQTAPYNLDGSGIKVGVWDGGSVRNTHQEFNTTRVVKKNSTVAVDDHATHVAGTIGASGFQASAKGMAPLVAIDSYDWNSDSAEMTAVGAATTSDSFATKIPLSNHSYGFNAVTADMGRYETECNTLDALALSLPYYLVFWAAGNEQDTLTALGGYQSITYNGLAKNVLTVGAGDDAVTSGVRDVTKGTLAYFSSMGPCDDGRIKPDLVANGVNVNSCISTSDTAYDATYSGTSMATPNAAGSATLLVQLYSREFSSQRMRSSMLKALLIHTADDVGRPGPDYQYGWGYLNVKAAADVILAHKASLAAPKMVDDSISNASKTKTYSYKWDGSSPLRATLCWTDPAGVAQTATDSRTPNLKHNLDLKITAPDGTTIYQPYTMPFVGTWTQASMTLNATKGKNNVDNVERVDVPTPTQTGTYIVTVSLDGTLTTSTQAFSLVVTGTSSVETNPPPVVNITTPTNGSTVLPISTISITATATDLAVGGQLGEVTKVEFYDGSTLLGEDTSAPYQFSWANMASGAHVITAKATDREGASTISSAVNVNVLIGTGAPTITSFSPNSGVAGDSVVISGDNLGAATAVQFGSLTATFTVNSPSQITAVVPANAVTAPITVSNIYGSVTSSANFSILPILFREDFSSVTVGDNTSSGGSSTAWGGNSNFPTGLNDYQAGGAVKLGANSASGSITSKEINLAGNGGAFTVSFKVKGWSKVEGDIKVTAGAQTQTFTYIATMSGDFETKTLSFTGGTSATTIKIETTAKRAFIDYVVVTATVPTAPPVITSPSTAAGIAGQAFTYQITASNAPTSFGATNLPVWASINTTNGLISGANPTSGTNVVSISASNSLGVASTNLTITILPSGGGGGSFSGVLAGWDFNGLTAAGVSPQAPTTTNTNVTVGGLTRGSAFGTTGSPAGNAWGTSVSVTSPTSATSAVTANSFITFTVKANTGYTLSLSNIPAYNVRRSGTGPTSGQWQYSTNGTTFTDIGSSITWGSVTSGSSGNPQIAISLSGISALQSLPATTTVTFRCAVWGATGTSGSWYLNQFQTGDDFVVAGTVASTNSTPSPSISTSGSLSAVNTVYGTAALIPANFTVSGTNLVEGITVAPPSGFEVSVGNTTSFAGKDSSITVGSAGTIAATPIYVRLAADTPVGTYAGNITCRSVGAAEVSVATVASTVSPKPISVTAGSVRKTYGASDPELTYTYSEVAPFSGSLVRDAGEAAGSYRIRQGSLTAGPNFAISFTEVDFSILKKRLSITADNRTKALGQTLALGVGQTGFTHGEMVGTDKIDTVTITASGGTEANDPAGTYVLTPSAPVGQNFAIGNYDIYYTPGTLTVTEGSAAVTLSEWATQNGLIGADAAPDADPDGDGVSNLMAYYMALDPKAGQGMVGYGLKPVTEGSLSLTYRRSKGVTGLSATVQANGDLSSSWNTPSVQESVVDKGTYEEVTATVTTPTGSTKMFMRLRVTQP
jgi:hypothetical protein